MTTRPSAVVGKWRIFEADLWAPKDLDLVEAAYIRFDADGGGKLICVAGAMDCGLSHSGADFTWQGFDEMDETSSGEAEIGDDGILIIEISFHHADQAVLKARRW